MSTATLTRAGVGTLPSVNLLPPEIHERRRLRVLQYRLAGGVGAAVVLVAAGGFWAHGSVSSANADLTAVQTRHSTLVRQLATFENVKRTDAQVAAAESMLKTAMAGDVTWSRFLNDISLKIPDGVWLTEMQAASAATTPAGTAAAATASPANSGTITFKGDAKTQDDVAAWLDAVGGEKGFTNPYFTDSTQTKIGPTKVYGFTSTVQLTPDALSGRATAAAGG